MRISFLLCLFLATAFAFHPLPKRSVDSVRNQIAESVSNLRRGHGEGRSQRPNGKAPLPAGDKRREFAGEAAARLSSRSLTDSTSVLVNDEVGKTSEHFLVVIDHIEQDLAEDGKTLLAGRDIRVSLRFDVDEQSRVSLNGAPVAQGFSQLKVKAQIFEVKNEEHVPFGDLLEVSVRVFVGHEQIQGERGSFTKVIVQERVVGIESSEVWQADVFEQSFIVRKDGQVMRLAFVKVETMRQEIPSGETTEIVKEPEEHRHHGHHGPHHGPHGHHHGPHGEDGAEGPEEPELPEGPHGPFADVEEEGRECIRKMKHFFHEAMEWFHGLSFPLRVLVAFGGGVCLGLIGVMVIRCFRCLCCCSSKKKQPKQDQFKSNLKAYSIHYTALPTDEKDAKKGEDNSIQMV